MPEIPDLAAYVDALNARLQGSSLQDITLASPFLLRTVTPGVEAFKGLKLLHCERLAKQLVFVFEQEYYLVIHLMISGRLQFSNTYKPPNKRTGLAAFQFSTGTVGLTEASKKKRASLRMIKGAENLRALDPGGLEIMTASPEDFKARLRSVNHTLKRALTDQRIFAGIGNAYSDEILLQAKLSPFKQTQSITEEEASRLYVACQSVITLWTERLSLQAAGKFPTKVTAFHAEMNAHGKYRQPCKVCGHAIQRIVYAENEANYCAHCQTQGRVLADRSLSRLLKDNWPKRLEDLES